MLTSVFSSIYNFLIHSIYTAAAAKTKALETIILKDSQRKSVLMWSPTKNAVSNDYIL